MRWPACQNAANCTALVRRDYIPEPAAIVDHFAGPGADCVLYFKTKIAGNIKR